MEFSSKKILEDISNLPSNQKDKISELREKLYKNRNSSPSNIENDIDEHTIGILDENELKERNELILKIKNNINHPTSWKNLIAFDLYKWKETQQEKLKLNISKLYEKANLKISKELYYNHEDYLAVLIGYAKWLDQVLYLEDESHKIYQYLLGEEIGIENNSFYINYAKFLFRHNNPTKAFQIITMGKQKKIINQQQINELCSFWQQQQQLQQKNIQNLPHSENMKSSNFQQLNLNSYSTPLNKNNLITPSLTPSTPLTLDSLKIANISPIISSLDTPTSKNKTPTILTKINQISSNKSMGNTPITPNLPLLNSSNISNSSTSDPKKNIKSHRIARLPLSGAKRVEFQKEDPDEQNLNENNQIKQKSPQTEDIVLLATHSDYFVNSNYTHPSINQQQSSLHSHQDNYDSINNLEKNEKLYPPSFIKKDENVNNSNLNDNMKSELSPTPIFTTPNFNSNLENNIHNNNNLQKIISSIPSTEIKKKEINSSISSNINQQISNNLNILPNNSNENKNISNNINSSPNLIAFEIVKEWSKEIIQVNGKSYVRLSCIGKGGSSKVFKVISQDLNIYAIKQVNLKGTDSSTLSNYINEINLLQALKNQKTIIKYIDSEIDKNHEILHLVLEYGEIDLAHLLQQQFNSQSSSSLNPNFIRLCWQQMLEAVMTVHNQRIVHSDLKPANFVFVQGTLKLIDFGIAKAIQNDTTNIVRESQIGTINYISPEALIDINEGPSHQQCMKLGRASDIWSLGCILYQMVYGKTPFSHLNMYKKLKYIPDPKYEIPFPHIPDPMLLNVLQSCLQRDPKKRPTLSELLSHPYLNPTYTIT